MNNSNKTDHASKHLGIFASKSVFQKTNVGGVGTPPYVAAIHLIIIGAWVWVVLKKSSWTVGRWIINGE